MKKTWANKNQKVLLKNYLKKVKKFTSGFYSCHLIHKIKYETSSEVDSFFSLFFSFSSGQNEQLF